MNNGRRDAFALALKLLKNDLVSCINLGIGGFDTHANQERSMQPIVESFDYLLTVFLNGTENCQPIGQHSGRGLQRFWSHSQSERTKWTGSLALRRCFDDRWWNRWWSSCWSNRRRYAGINNQHDLRPSRRKWCDLKPHHLAGSVLELTLGSSYLGYRTYMESIPALTRLKGS